MASYLVNIISSQDVGDLSFSNWGKGRVTRELSKVIEGIGVGAFTGALDVQVNPNYAYGFLKLASGSGAVGGTIGGKTVTATWATSDANTCDLIAAAINADTTANTYCTATSRVASGTLTISGGSGVITAIINGTSVSVTWTSSDVTTATNLATAINATAGLPVIASAASGVVTFYATTPGTGGNSITLAGSGTGVSVSGALLTGGGTNANVLIQALVAGTMGNAIAVTASGTGVTGPASGRFAGGLGGPGNSFIA